MFTEKSLSAADIAMFLEQFVGVTPGMHPQSTRKAVKYYSLVDIITQY